MARGHRVTVVDDFRTSDPSNLSSVRRNSRFRLIRADVREMPDGRYERVYHLASPASPDKYGAAPIDTALTNAVGTHRALDIALRSRARFLLASTSEVYGDPLEHPQRETYWGNVNPTGPRSSYDEGKRFAEALTTAYVAEHAIDARIVRIFNTYGPRMRPDDGRMPSAFITSAVRGEPITIQGTGSQTRSLCYVADTVRGLVATMERGRSGGIYNIGRPDETTVLAFARTVKRLSGSSSQIVRVAGRREDIRRRKPDIRKARRELGWTPTTILSVGLRKTIRWFSAELDVTRRPDVEANAHRRAAR